MQNSAGLPLSVAVMTPMWQDEEFIAVMSIIELVMQFDAKPEVFKLKTKEITLKLIRLHSCFFFIALIQFYRILLKI